MPFQLNHLLLRRHRPPVDAPALASRHISDNISSKTLATSIFSKNTAQLQRWAVSKVCAQSSNGYCCCVFACSRLCCSRPRHQVVGLGGLEPPASPLSGVRSNHLSYRPKVKPKTGGACRDRTDDPLLAKQVLSQLSYSPEGLKGGSAALLDICRLLVWTPWNGEVVLERR